jgi:hypothetical protein
MRLTVKGLASQDCWKDIVRIKDMYRLDRHGKHIKRGAFAVFPSEIAQHGPSYMGEKLTNRLFRWTSTYAAFSALRRSKYTILN